MDPTCNPLLGSKTTVALMLLLAKEAE